MKIFRLILLILWMSLIFFLSNLKGDESSYLSNNLINNTIVKVYKVFKPEVNREIILKKYSYPIRKLAHFTEYFILGLLILPYLGEYNMKDKILISIIFCISYAISDEIHQYFIDNRSSSIIDIIIDSLGSIFAIFLKNVYNSNYSKGDNYEK